MTVLTPADNEIWDFFGRRSPMRRSSRPENDVVVWRERWESLQDPPGARKQNLWRPFSNLWHAIIKSACYAILVTERKFRSFLICLVCGKSTGGALYSIWLSQSTLVLVTAVR
ncbi:hypothetical protein BHE74_00010013 [Ensete ventricosum]|nr:hypothetical protein GW17_00012974 [Ensete ventricosum]RWW81580.1 hypothetical protein BHE74_00010013 [Ensete ventricosum]RZS25391.1 hypothetical protein BHM03_00058582 [Ensete ventricosum]